MSKAEFAAAIGVAAGLDEKQKQIALTQAQVLALPTTTTGKFYATDTGRFFTVYANTWRRYIPNTADIGALYFAVESKEFFDAFPPVNVVLANNGVYNIANYPALAAKYGATFGGNGTTTFAVPDFTGVGIRGANLGVGNDPDHAGRTGGLGVEKIGSWQNDDVKSHKHFLDRSLRRSSNGASWNNNFAGWDNFGDLEVTPSTLATGGLETRMKNRSSLICIVALSII